MNYLFRYFGNIDILVTSAAFLVAIALLVQRGSPRFSQLSSTMFGLFYCGYLPCFWVKLRCGLAAPALNTGKLSPFLSLKFSLLRQSSLLSPPTSDVLLTTSFLLIL